MTGCTKIGAGCAHCYAERFAERWRGVKGHPYTQGFDLKLWPARLDLPLRWKQPKFIFVNSMSDLFHEKVSLGYIREVFSTIRHAHWHRFQLLTKRAERLGELAEKLEWPENLWVGVTVVNRKASERIDHLRKVPAAVRFLSAEPLLESLGKLNLKGIDWVITGGESGPGARPVKKEWVTEVRDQCLEKEVPFFFKQWGGFFKKRAGRKLDGRVWNEMPGAKKESAQAGAREKVLQTA